MVDYGFLFVGLGLILVSAELFTNGIEWLGKRLNLSEGAVGSILAAVGTALPETLVPVIAIIFGTGEATTEIGIGAILGAPFMLGTLAMFVTGLAGLVFFRRRRTIRIGADYRLMSRDLGFFVCCYTLAILAAFTGEQGMKHGVAGVLILSYVVYVYLTLQGGQTTGESELSPLIFARRSYFPRFRMIIIQVVAALIGIVVGAEFFVEGINHLAVEYAISPLILSMIITPIATELPEKFNSVIWMSKGKDTLALGNITGAMVFQSSVIPAIGIALTPWKFSLGGPQVFNAGLALLSAGFLWLVLKVRKRINAFQLLGCGVFYLAFIWLIFKKII